MKPTTPEENEEQKLIQYAQSHPGFIARLLGKLRKGVIEKPSLKKQASGRINAQKARDALKHKRDLEKDVPKNESSE